MNTALKIAPQDEKTTHTIETMSGNIIDFYNLEHIVTPFDEIALVMCRLPVNNGHQVAHSVYTLAHHSLWVMRYVLWLTGSPKAALYALVNRAHEVYVGSMPAPMQALSYIQAPIRFLNNRMQDLIHINLGLNVPNSDTVDIIIKAELIASALEAEKFLPSRHYQQYVEKIPEAAREIAWDNCDSSVIYEEMMNAYNVLMYAIKDQEQAQ